jgi:hypothetical protein
MLSASFREQGSLTQRKRMRRKGEICHVICKRQVCTRRFYSVTTKRPFVSMMAKRSSSTRIDLIFGPVSEKGLETWGPWVAWVLLTREMFQIHDPNRELFHKRQSEGLPSATTPFIGV